MGGEKQSSGNSSKTMQWITPAWAGKSLMVFSVPSTTSDHPRMGGEKAMILHIRANVSGSPPHGRGKG